MNIDKFRLIEAFKTNSQNSQEVVTKSQEDQKAEKALDPNVARASVDAVKVEIDRESSTSPERIAELKAKIENDSNEYYRQNREQIAGAVYRELFE